MLLVVGVVGTVAASMRGTGLDNAGASLATSPATTQPCDRDRVLVTAHRGTGSGTRTIQGHAFSENTVPAFVEALALGADGIEADYWPTADGKIVTHHDRTLDRMTNGSGRIDRHTWTAIARLREAGGARVPTFDTVVAAVERVGGHRQQEIKLGRLFSDRMLRHMIETEVRDSPSAYERVLYTSSRLSTLRRIHSIDPRLPTGLITLSATDRPVLARLPEWLDVVHVDLRAADAAYVHAAAERGYAVSVRGVDTAAQLHQAVTIGATRVLTHRPDVLGRRCAQSAQVTTRSTTRALG